MEILNKKAKFDYFIEDTFECGIVLKGTEIKSIRSGKANLKDSYGIIKNNEITAEIIGKYLLTRDNYKKENIKVLFSKDDSLLNPDIIRHSSSLML